MHIDNKNIRELHLSQDNLHILQSGKKILCNNFCSYLNGNFFTACTSFANVDINTSIVDERHHSSSHSLTETNSSTLSLTISFCDLSRKTK